MPMKKKKTLENYHSVVQVTEKALLWAKAYKGERSNYDLEGRSMDRPFIETISKRHRWRENKHV